MPDIKRRRRLHPLSFLAFVVVLTGAKCGGGDDPKPDTADSSTTSSTTRPGGPRPEKLWSNRPGNEPERWQSFVARLPVKDSAHRATTRGCKGDAPHDHGKDRDEKRASNCVLVIQPVENAHNIDTDSLDEAGYLAARISNVGNVEEGYFGIDAGQTVYLRVYRRPPRDSAGVRVPGALASQILDSATGTPLNRPDPEPDDTRYKVSAGFEPNEFPFTVCTPQHRRWNYSRAKFQSCAEAANEHREGGVAPLNQHNSPAWIACLQGCCSVEGP